MFSIKISSFFIQAGILGLQMSTQEYNKSQILVMLLMSSSISFISSISPCFPSIISINYFIKLNKNEPDSAEVQDSFVNISVTDILRQTAHMNNCWLRHFMTKFLGTTRLQNNK